MTVGQVLSPVSPLTPRSKVVADFSDRGDALGTDERLLEGLRVGLRGDDLWRSWEWVLGEWTPLLERQGAELTSWRAETRGGTEAERAQKELKEFLNGLDIAIIGLGTCGSCTMFTVNDALESRKRGIRTVAVVTEHFESLARTVASRAGDDDVEFLVLPYPLETRPESEVREIAKAHFTRLIRSLHVGS